MRNLIYWIKSFEDNETESRREKEPAHNIVGSLRFLDSLLEDSYTELTTVKIDSHCDEAPLKKIDEVSDAKK